MAFPGSNGICTILLLIKNKFIDDVMGLKMGISSEVAPRKTFVKSKHSFKIISR